MGLDVVPARFVDKTVVDSLGTATPVKGLWLTGQDTLLCGVPLAQASGLVTAFRVLGLWQSLCLAVVGGARILRQAAVGNPSGHTSG